jgi:hypothetical protein
MADSVDGQAQGRDCTLWRSLGLGPQAGGEAADTIARRVLIESINTLLASLDRGGF